MFLACTGEKQGKWKGSKRRGKGVDWIDSCPENAIPSIVFL